MITTSMFRLNPKVSDKDPRNRHLIPEVSLRTERILDGVIKESANAFAVNPIPVVLYKKLDHGRNCSCKSQAIDKDKTNAELSSNLSLNDFLVKIPTLLPTKDSCPICFDVGYVSGYARKGAMTVVLDSTLKNTVSNSVQIKKERPFWYMATNVLGKVSWNLTIPRYFTSVLDVVIRWKKEPTVWKLEVNNQTITSDLLDSLKGEQVTFSLKMKDSSGEAGIYAVFIVFEISTKDYPADFPNLARSLTGDMNIVNEITTPITVIFNAQVEKLNTTDIFLDTRYYRMWRILEINHTDPMKKVIQLETQSRMVRDFETSYFLPNKLIAKNYYNYENYTFVV